MPGRFPQTAGKGTRPRPKLTPAGPRMAPVAGQGGPAGQETISMMAGRYSHFFPRSDDSAEPAAAELDLIAVG
jgi:hypothetical protein